MKNYKKKIGDFGERIAGEYLKAHGYKVRVRNYRCSFGEIDLVADKGGTLIFVEVKTRSSDEFGIPAAAVDRKKQCHIWKCAENYLLENPWDGDISFDVMEVYAKFLPDSGFQLKKVEHIKNIVMEV